MKEIDKIIIASSDEIIEMIIGDFSNFKDHKWKDMNFDCCLHFGIQGTYNGKFVIREEYEDHLIEIKEHIKEMETIE